MKTEISKEQQLALSMAAAWRRLENRLDSSLGAIRGISLAEYRLLRALADAPGAWASRVDLAKSVGLTPSGVTRALRPMEKLGMVSTARSKRDARLSLTSLTPAGKELVNDACAVVNDTVKSITQRSSKVSGRTREITDLLDDFCR